VVHVALQNHFSLQSLVIYLFSNPTKSGTASRCETTNSNPPGLIKLSSQSTTAVFDICSACTSHAFFLSALAACPKIQGQHHVLNQTGLF